MPPPRSARFDWSIIGWTILRLALMNQLLTWSMVRPVSWASCFFWSSEGYGCWVLQRSSQPCHSTETGKKLTVRCWKSHALMMLVATLGKIPLFFCLFLARSSSSSSPVPSPEPTEASPKNDPVFITIKMRETSKWLVKLVVHKT